MDNYFVESNESGCKGMGNGVWIAKHVLNSKNYCVSPHIHTAVELLYFLDGKCRAYADDVEYIVGEGDLIVVRSNTIHKVYPLVDFPCAHIVIQYTPEQILGFSSKANGIRYLLQLALKNKTEKTLWTKEECDKNGITELFANIMTEYKSISAYSDISTKVLAAQILLAVLRDTEYSEDKGSKAELSDENLARRIYNSTIYINGHYSEDITASDCAKQVFMSYSYFSRCFKKVMGMSFKDYLNHTRINNAESALMSTNKSISEISLDCGFNNVSYFISTYKKMKGMTPSAFRSAGHCGKP